MRKRPTDMSGVARGALGPVPRVNGGYSTALRIRRGSGGVRRSCPDDARMDRAPARLPGRVSGGGPLGVGPAPSPPQPRDRVSGFPPEPADPASSAGAVGKSRRPVPGGLQAAEVAGLPLAAFSPPQNPALRLGLGSFPAATAPAGPTPETGEEEEEGNVARRTRLPEPLSPCQPVMPGRSPRPRTKRAQGTGRSSRWEASSPHPVPPPPPRPVPAAAPRG